MKARVTVTLKTGVLDPQGKAIEGALHSLGIGASQRAPGQGVRHRVVEGRRRRGRKAAAEGRLRKAAGEHGRRKLPRRDPLTVEDRAMKAAVVLFPGSNREGDAVRALEQAAGRKPQIVWHADTTCPQERISSCCPAASPTATICAAAPSPGARQSWTPCAPMPRAAALCSASATDSRFSARAACCPAC